MAQVVSPDLINHLVHRLTARDRYLCRLLYDHKVLTTAHIADVAFPSERRARQRLAKLTELTVVDRFAPHGAGNAAHHFTLGPAGAAVVAADRDVDVEDLAWRRDRAYKWSLSPRLSHLVGVNGFFTALTRTARTSPGCRLAEWYSEWRCAEIWGAVVRPDGYGEWCEDDGNRPFLLEYDRGTENLSRLADKLTGYAKLARSAGHQTWVLFAFGSPRREAEARRVLGHEGVAVATSALEARTSPAGPIWAPVGASRAEPVRLAHLGDPDDHLSRTRGPQ